MVTISSITTTILQYANLSFIPAQYRWLVPIGIVFIGLLMLFRSRDTWKFLIAAIGAIGTYYAVEHYGAKYYSAIMVAHGIPLYIVPLIAAIIGSILLTVLVRFALSAGIGYAAFMYLGVHYKLDIAITVSVVIGAVAYYLYNKIITILARFVGAFMLFFGLVMMHVPENTAAMVMAVLLLISMIWLIGRKKIIAAYHRWQERRKLRTPKVKKEKTQKASKVKDPNKTGKGVIVKMEIKKLLSLPKKLIPHRKDSDQKPDATEAVQPDTVQTGTSVASTPAVITHVKADGTVTVEEVKK